MFELRHSPCFHTKYDVYIIPSPAYRPRDRHIDRPYLLQVLSANGSTYASDVYSFSIVAWEVLSRELPWADVTHPREVYIRVVLNELRPDIPAEAPADLAAMIRACWAGDPEARPTFVAVMTGMRPHDWGECESLAASALV